jgi:hypothetical protein
MWSNAGMANRQLALRLGSEHSCSTTQTDTSRRKKPRPPARPRYLVARALHHSAEHASQHHSALQLHQSQALQSTVDLRPVSRGSNGTSSFVADWRPLHYTAAWLYAAANTTGESPVADTKTKHGILATALGDCTS